MRNGKNKRPAGTKMCVGWMCTRASRETLKPPTQPTSCDCLKELWHIHRMEYYTVTKKHIFHSKLKALENAHGKTLNKICKMEICMKWQPQTRLKTHQEGCRQNVQSACLGRWNYGRIIPTIRR